MTYSQTFQEFTVISVFIPLIEAFLLFQMLLEVTKKYKQIIVK